MIEFNPNCGKCGMLNSRGFCSLTACRYPSNVIVVEPKVIRGMMVNPQIEKPMSNGDTIRSMSDYDLADWIAEILIYHGKVALNEYHVDCDKRCPLYKCCNDQPYDNIEDWLKSPADKEETT